MSFLPGMFPAGSLAGAAAAVPFTTAWRSAGTGANNASAGAGPWSNPGNIVSSNNSVATFGGGGGYTPLTSQILRATNFGFTTSDIPVGATIFGIEVGIERRSTGGFPYAVDVTIRLRTSSGQIGSNKAVGTQWPVSDTELVYGGAADMWGTSLADSDIRASTFGVDMQGSVGDTYAGNGGAVDHIRIRVYGEA